MRSNKKNQFRNYLRKEHQSIFTDQGLVKWAIQVPVCHCWLLYNFHITVTTICGYLLLLYINHSYSWLVVYWVVLSDLGVTITKNLIL